MNRITNEQREGIVRKAVAERDAILASPAPSDAAVPTAPAGARSQWNLYDLTPACMDRLPRADTEVLLWTVEDYWDDEVHIIRTAVHMGEVREEDGSRYLIDYMDTNHSAITHWMPLPGDPAISDRAALAAAPLDRIALSEEEIRAAVNKCGLMFTAPDIQVARAIEAEHGITLAPIAGKGDGNG